MSGGPFAVVERIHFSEMAYKVSSMERGPEQGPVIGCVMKWFEAMRSPRPHPASIARLPDRNKCQHKGSRGPGARELPTDFQKEAKSGPAQPPFILTAPVPTSPAS